MGSSTRQVPFSSLRANLGNGSHVSMVHRGADREYHRTWECGCTAVYRDTLHHTARWRPCPQHASMTNSPSRDSGGTRLDDAIPKTLSTASRRSSPQFFLLDDQLNVVAASSGEGLADLIRQALRTAPSWMHDAPSVVPLTDDVFLRVVPLERQWSHLKMVFVESLRGRGGLEAVARRFGLTQREIDVLRLLISSKSNTEIAQALSIAESTVGDHLKSIFRKMNSTRRTQVITQTVRTGGLNRTSMCSLGRSIPRSRDGIRPAALA